MLTCDFKDIKMMAGFDSDVDDTKVSDIGCQRFIQPITYLLLEVSGIRSAKIVNIRYRYRYFVQNVGYVDRSLLIVLSADIINENKTK